MKNITIPFSEKIRTSIDTYFKDWNDEVQEMKTDEDRPIMKVTEKGDKLKLDAHYDERALAVMLEMKNLTNLGFKVSLLINYKHQAIETCYPIYISLKDSLATFNIINA